MFLVLSACAISAAHVDNAASTTLLSNGFLDPEQAPIVLRAAIEIDYTKDLKMEQEGFEPIDSYQMHIYNAKFVMNWGEVLDVFGRVGKNYTNISFINKDPDLHESIAVDSKNCITSKHDVGYSLGARLLLWKGAESQCSIGYRYDHANLQLTKWEVKMDDQKDLVNLLAGDSPIIDPENLILNYRATQVDIGISYDNGGILHPYAGVKYSIVNSVVRTLEEEDLSPTLVLNNRSRIGFFVGTSIYIGDATPSMKESESDEVQIQMDGTPPAIINVAARFIDESALNISLEFRF